MSTKTISKILIAALATAVIVLGRVLMRSFLDEEAAYMPFLIAILLTAYLAGPRAGLLAVALALLSGNFFFVEPIHHFHLGDWRHLLQMLLFGILGVLSCLLVGTVRRSQVEAAISAARADAQQRQLELETTERLRILSNLRDSEAQFEQLADTLPHMVWVTRPDGQTVYVNDRWSAYTGLSREQSLGNGWLVAMHPDDRKPSFDRWCNARDTGQTYETECRFLSKEGRYHWFLSRALPVTDRSGTIVKWFGTSTDIDAQKRSGQALERRLTREAKQRTLIKEVADASLTIHSARTLSEVLDVVTSEARQIIRAHLAIGSLTVSEDWRQTLQSVSVSGKYGQWSTQPIQMDAAGIYSIICQTQRPIRLARAQLTAHPDLASFQSKEGHPPLEGWLATALVGRDNHNIGVLQLSDKIDGEFTEDDESVLLQLASIAAVAIENVRLLQVMREADRRKDEFLAMMAHELRNPLAPIRNSLEVLQMGNAAPEDTSHALVVMDRQIDQMVRLVDDLLDIARINRGKLTLRLEPLDLVDVLENAIDAARPLIDANRHKLVVSIPPSSIPVEGDMTRLSQVFQNLLNNAAKYTDPGGQITLVTRLEDDAVQVEISDNGIGIPASILPHVFDMFIQGDQSLERTRGGLGIGLTLVHTLVQLHRGSISVSSNGVLGEGSQFSVRLPLRKTVTLSSPPVGIVSTNGAVSHRVVVVDDNVDSAETLGRLLELMGHEVRTAHDGEAALGVVTQFQPDVVFLDIGLPKLNGYEVAKRIRSDGASSPAMRLIALTGWGQEGDRLRSKDAGFDFHLTKPADPEEIVRIMGGESHISS